MALFIIIQQQMLEFETPGQSSQSDGAMTLTVSEMNRGLFAEILLQEQIR